MSPVQLVVLCTLATVLSACVEPTTPAAATDCVKVASWVELGLNAEKLIENTAQDEAYNEVIAERTALGSTMSEHELRFGGTLVSQLATRAVAPYADIYGLCRKWETGNY